MRKVNQYIKNVAKSFEYAAIDAVKETMPSAASFMETNTELFKDISYTLRNKKLVFNRTADKFKQSKIYEAGDEFKKNLFEDIKSGKFYNKDADRIARINAKSFGDMGEDSGLESTGFVFDMDEYEWEDTDTGVLSQSIASSNRMSSQAVAEAVARTGEYLAENSRINAQMSYLQVNEGFKTINTNLGNISSVISGSMNSLSEVVHTHAQNSKTYYENMTNTTREMNALLKELVEMERNRYTADLKNEMKKTSSSYKYSDLTASGVPDIRAYLGNIKKNVGNKLGGLTGMNEMFGEDSNMLMQFAQSPLSLLPKAAVKKLIGRNITSSMGRLDKSMQNAFASFITTINALSRSDNDMIKNIADIFKIDNRLRSIDSVDTSKYNKGAMQWNGLAQKSLTEVLPTQLGKILSILSGQAEQVYDFEKGKFVTVHSIRKDLSNKKKAVIDSSFFPIKEQFEEMLKLINFTGRQRKEFDEDLSKFFEYFFKSGVKFDHNRKDQYDYEGGIGISSNSYDLITSMFKELQHNQQYAFDRAIVESRDNYTRMIDEIEKSNNTIYNTLINGSSDTVTTKLNRDGKVMRNQGIGSFLTNITDEKGNTIFYYLRGMYKTLLEGVKTYVINPAGNAGNRGRRDRSADAILNRSTDIYVDSEALNRNNPSSSSSTQYGDRQYARNLSENPDMLTYDELVSNTNPINVFRGRIQANRHERSLLDERNRNNKQSKLIKDLISANNIAEKVNVFVNKMKNVADKPATMIAGILDTVDLRLYQVLYGMDKKEYKGREVRGIIDIAVINIEDTFSKLNEWLDEHVLEPFQDKWEQWGGFKGIYESFLQKIGVDPENNPFSNFFKNVKDNLKEDLSSIWNYGKNSVKETYSDLKEALNIDSLGTSIAKLAVAIEKNTVSQENNTEQLSEVQDTVPTSTRNDDLFGSVPNVSSSARRAIENITAKDQLNRAAIDNRILDNFPHYADGTDFVERTGLAVLSRGEAVLTPEENRKRMLEQKYKNRIQSAKDKVLKYSQYDANTFIGPLPSKKDEKYLRKYSKMYNGITDENYSSIASELGFDAETKEEVRSRVLDIIGEKEGGPSFAEEMMETGRSAIAKVSKSLFGVDIDADDEEQSKRRKEATNQIAKNLKQYLPSMTSGALIGLIGGSFVGGPLLGAAVGASVNLIRKSNKVQEYLFGKDVVNEDGTVSKDGGVISKKIVNTVQKYAPSIGKYGITGAISSLILPGGPILGLMVGSSIGFIKENEAAQDWLFGENGMFKGAKEKTDKFKKMLPKLGVGAVAGTLLGPFGIFGNLMLGSAVGFAAQTNKFQEFMFGKENEETGEKEGGLLPSLKKHIVDPVKEWSTTIKDKIVGFMDENIKKPFQSAMKPFIHEFKNLGKSLFDSVKNSIDSIFESAVGMPLSELMEEKIIKPFKGMFSKVFKFFGKVIGGLISAPVKMLKAGGDSLKLKHLRQGDADYLSDEELKQLYKDKPLQFLMNTRGARTVGTILDSLTSDEDPNNPSMFTRLRNFVSGKMDDASETTKGIFGRTADKIRGITASGIDRARNSVDNFKDKMYEGIEVQARTQRDQLRNGERAQYVMNQVESQFGKPKSKKVSTARLNTQAKQSPEVIALQQKIEEMQKHIAVIAAEKDEYDNTKHKMEERDTKKLRDNVQEIRDEVVGQLDGLGYNIHTIANILVEKLGMPEIKAKGSKVSRGNLRRQNFFERLIGKPFKKIKEGFNNFFFGKDGESGLLGRPIKMVKGVFAKISEMGDKIGKALVKVIELPFKIAGAIKDVGLFVGKTVIEGVKTVVPAIGEVLAAGVRLLAVPFDALGAVISGVAEGIGNGIGALVEGMGHLAGGVFKLVGAIPEVVSSIASVLANFTKSVGKVVGSIVDFGTSLASGFMDFLFPKRTKKKEKRFVMEGGTIDLVKKVEEVHVHKNHFDPLFNFLTPKFDMISSSIRTEVGDVLRSEMPSLSNNVRHLSSPSVQSMPTPHGVIRYDVDSSGEARPIKDRVYQEYTEAQEAEAESKNALLARLGLGGGSGSGESKKPSIFDKIFGVLGNILSNPLGLLAIGGGIYGLLKMLGGNAVTDAVDNVAKSAIDMAKDSVGDFLTGEQGPSAIAGKGMLKTLFGFINKTANTVKGGINVARRGVNAIKSGTNTARNAVNTMRGSNVARTIAGGTDNATSTALRVVASGTDDTAKVSIKTGAEISQAMSKGAAAKAAGGTDNVASVIASGQSGSYINKFINMAKSTFDDIIKALVKKFPAIASKTSKLKGIMTKYLVPKIVKKFTGKIVSGFLKTVSTVVTYGLSDAVLGTWGFLTGLTDTETAQLFKINQSDVDGTMRLISGGIGCIVNIGPTWILDLVNEIIDMVSGGEFDIIQMVAGALYNVIASLSNKDKEKLTNSQNKFKQEKDQFNSTYKTNLNLYQYNEITNPDMVTAILHNKKNELFEAKIKETAAEQNVSLSDHEASIFARNVNLKRENMETVKDSIAKSSSFDYDTAAKILGTTDTKAINKLKDYLFNLEQNSGLSRDEIIKLGERKTTYNYANSGLTKSVAEYLKAVESKPTSTSSTNSASSSDKNSIATGAASILKTSPANASIAFMDAWNKNSSLSPTDRMNKAMAAQLAVMTGGIVDDKDILNKAGLKNSTESKKKSASNSILSSIKSWFGFGKSETTSGSGRGKETDVPHYSQRDPKWANQSFNIKGDHSRQTMSDSGCGPAVAAMVANSYSGYDNPANASRYALGYKEVDGGTNPQYFNDYLGAKGIQTQTDPNVANSKKSVVNNLKSGKPVILMGQGGRGTPYGESSPHYVVATGVRGNKVVVNDPYSARGRETYNLDNVLNSSSLGIYTSGRGKYGRGALDTFKKAASNMYNTASSTIKTAATNLSTNLGLSKTNTSTSTGSDYSYGTDDYSTSTTGSTSFLASGEAKVGSYTFIQDLIATAGAAVKEVLGIKDDSSSTSGFTQGGLQNGYMDGFQALNADDVILEKAILKFYNRSPRKVHTKLKSAVKDIIAAAREVDSRIDPLLMAVIFYHETGGGVKVGQTLIDRNNPGACMTGSTKIGYPSMKAGMIASAKVVKKGFDTNGLSIAGVGAVYCPVGAENDPTNVNPNWVPQVTSYYNEIRQYAIEFGATLGVSASGTELGNKIISVASQYIGKVSYKYGADNLDGGVADCSAFTKTVFKKCGVSIPRTSREQFKVCSEVSVPQAGDLVFFCNGAKTPAGITHVGIATGQGYGMIHCGSSKGVEHVSNFYNGGNWYSDKYYRIARHPKLGTASGRGKDKFKSIINDISTRSNISAMSKSKISSIGNSVSFGKGKSTKISNIINNAYNSEKGALYGKGLNGLNSITSKYISGRGVTKPTTSAPTQAQTVTSTKSQNARNLQQQNTNSLTSNIRSGIINKSAQQNIFTRGIANTPAIGTTNVQTGDINVQLLKVVIELITKVVNNGNNIARLIQILVENGIIIRQPSTTEVNDKNKQANKLINNIVQSMDTSIDNARFDGMIKSLTEIASQ